MDRILIALTFGLLIASPALAQKALPASHPLLGTWRIDLPDVKCFEEYELRADGTKSTRSGKAVTESEFKLSEAPTAKGFYKWTDKITKSNDEADCFGSFPSIGDAANSFVRIESNGSMFQLCESEEISSCFAEFRRKQ